MLLASSCSVLANLENLCTLIDVIQKQKPASSKGTYFKRIAISTTMGPGLRVEPQSAIALTAV